MSAVKHTKHNDFLDGLRGLASIAVLCFHLTIMNGLRFPPLAPLAVDFFFILSGYVIALAYEERLLDGRLGLREFCLKRLIRLYPLIFAGTCAGLVLIAAKGISSHKGWVGHFAETALLSFGLVPNFSVRPFDDVYPANTVVWSLFFELAANLLYAIAIRRLNTGVLVAISAVCGIAIAIVDITQGTMLFGFFPHLFWVGFLRAGYSFPVGVIIFRARKSQAGRVHSAELITFCLAAILFTPWVFRGLDALVVLIALPVLMYFATRAKTHPAFDRAYIVSGLISYPLYALHNPIIRAGSQIASKLHASQGYMPLVAIGEGMLSLAVAWFTLKKFDERFRKWLGRRYLARVGQA